MANLATQWRERTTGKLWENPLAYMDELLAFDPEGKITKTDLGPVILFSDGSQHLMIKKSNG